MRRLLVLGLLAGTLAAQARPSFLKAVGGGVLTGDLEVWENRTERKGRRIPLHVLVLKAQGDDPRPDPVFYIAGGPGQAATRLAGGLRRSWMRRDRDIVLVDQRGTGRSNGLYPKLPGSDRNLQGYLAPLFEVSVFEAAKRELEKRADLTQYTTPIAADDLNQVRQALGYDKINLVGGSYGTRFSLVYIRRHGETVRSAILTGIAPLAFKNPLYHAKAAQEGFDKLVAECKASPRTKVFHDLDKELAAILTRLAKEPAQVTIKHPTTGAATTIALSRDNFCEGMRVLMYYMPANRTVPLLVHRAFQGDYRPFARAAIQSNRNLRRSLAFGMLMSVVGSADIPRITEREIVELTKNTFLGDHRVRTQRAVAEIWPRGAVPADYGEPVRSDVPVLFLSGTHDPVTPPWCGEAAAKHFPNGLHLVVPAAHGTRDRKIEDFKRKFLTTGTTKGLDASFVATLHLAPIVLPSR